MMLGIYSRKEQHMFSAASNRKVSAPCASRIGLILELLSLLVFRVKLLLNVLAQRSEFLPLKMQLSFTPILAKASKCYQQCARSELPIQASRIAIKKSHSRPQRAL